MPKRASASQARVPSTFKELLEKKKLELRRKRSSLVQWGKENNYTEWQMYGVSRRTEPPCFGTAYEIAEKLGLIQELTH
jgi:hypothetical protein